MLTKPLRVTSLKSLSGGSCLGLIVPLHRGDDDNSLLLPSDLPQIVANV